MKKILILALVAFGAHYSTKADIFGSLSGNARFTCLTAADMKKMVDNKKTIATFDRLLKNIAIKPRKSTHENSFFITHVQDNVESTVLKINFETMPEDMKLCIFGEKKKGKGHLYHRGIRVLEQDRSVDSIAKHQISYDGYPGYHAVKAIVKKHDWLSLLNEKEYQALKKLNNNSLY